MLYAYLLSCLHCGILLYANIFSWVATDFSEELAVSINVGDGDDRFLGNVCNHVL
jgi:hypothetical protein